MAADVLAPCIAGVLDMECKLFLSSTRTAFTKVLPLIFRCEQNGRDFPDDIFICIFLNENVSISVKISLKFVPNGPIWE